MSEIKIEDIKKMNIYEKMACITNEIGMVAKNLDVSFGKGSYKAVSEIDIINAVKPLENKYRVYSHPQKREVSESYMIESENKSNKQFMRLHTKYIFVNIDKPDEKVEVDTLGDGVDIQDKAPGKAMTYADKYALMKAYKIGTGDDPDQYASEPISKKVDKEMQKAQLAYTKLRTRLTELGVNYRDDKTTVNWICEKAKIENQENTNLNLKELSRLNEVYRKLVEAKELKINEKIETF